VRMSENLSNFLADLGSNPDLLARLAADPATELAGTGLTQQEQAAILSRDPRLVGKVLGMSAQGQGAAGIKKKKKKKKKTPPKRKPAQKKKR
jgi:hypothetical protein